MAGLETISMETSRPILIKLFKQLDEQKKVNKTRAALMEKSNQSYLIWEYLKGLKGLF